jgi:hypothetical protein
MYRLLFSMFLGAFATSVGCEVPTTGPEPASCEACDDGNPCTSEACVGGVCQRDWVTPGASCLDAPGFCDSDGVCREECPAEPCFDAEVLDGYGCVYERRLNGWTCRDGASKGICYEGECVPPQTDPGATAD